jgi:mRNA-degrading endonuclease RelE of RelBE toxin-antitoxin system
MEHEIVFLSVARRDLRRLDPAVARRIVLAVQRYVDTGGGDVRRLAGTADELRLRVGDWRVRFTDRVEERPVEPPGSHTGLVRVIEIIRVRHRREAYDDL